LIYLDITDLMLENLGAKVHCYSLPPEDSRGNMFNILNLKSHCETSVFGDIRDKKSFEIQGIKGKSLKVVKLN
jgi:hypothetical protein